MIPRHAEYFHEWLAAFSEELFVILHVYADESCRDKASTLCGFIASPDYWRKFSRRWKSVLSNFGAPYFHFREFADKKNRWKIKGNPYLEWSEKQRDSFLYELVIVLSEEAVPIGSALDGVAYRGRVMEGGLDLKMLIAQFYGDVADHVNAHWPGFDGQVLFVFDETDNGNWISPLNEAHKNAQKLDQRIGGLAFEDDLRCPPLQAADLFAYLARQTSERYYAQDKTRQPKRTLDFILSKNMHPIGKQIHPKEWEEMARLILADMKQKKALWSKQGQPEQQYYPELHFDGTKHGFKLIDPTKP